MELQSGLPQIDKNGFVVNTIDKIEIVVKNLQSHPEILDDLAEETIKFAKSFDRKGERGSN